MGTFLQRETPQPSRATCSSALPPSTLSPSSSFLSQKGHSCIPPSLSLPGYYSGPPRHGKPAEPSEGGTAAGAALRPSRPLPHRAPAPPRRCPGPTSGGAERSSGRGSGGSGRPCRAHPGTRTAPTSPPPPPSSSEDLAAVAPPAPRFTAPAVIGGCGICLFGGGKGAQYGTGLGQREGRRDGTGPARPVSAPPGSRCWEGERAPLPRPPHLRQVRGSAGPPRRRPVRLRRQRRQEEKGARGSGGAPARAGVSIPRGRSEDPGARWAPQGAGVRIPGPAGLLGGQPRRARSRPALRGRSERARNRAGGIAAPSRPGSQRVLRPPRKNLRSVECGFGLARLLVKLSTGALRFPGQLECLVFSLFYLVVFYIYV